MRGIVHCLGMSLLLTGGVGLMYLMLAAVELLGKNLRLKPAGMMVQVESPVLLSQFAHQRVPFVIRRQ